MTTLLAPSARTKAITPPCAEGLASIDSREYTRRSCTLLSSVLKVVCSAVEIQALQKEKKELLARMQVIQDLQGNRPVIVRIFDEMVRTLSKGVHYRSLEFKGRDFKVEGTAESNNRISSLMRNLDDSGWFDAPNLRSIKEDPKNVSYGPQASTFDLTFIQVNPNADESEGD